MKVILMKRVSNLGMVGDIVEVKNGYARNYLIPKGLAIIANKANLKRLENEKKIIEALRRKEEEESKSLAEKLNELELIVEVRVGDTGKLYGSVTNGTISNVLKKQGFDIDKKMIELQSPIKQLGDYEVGVKLPGGFSANLKIKVVPQGESIEERLKRELEEQESKKSGGSEAEAQELRESTAEEDTTPKDSETTAESAES